MAFEWRAVGKTTLTDSNARFRPETVAVPPPLNTESVLLFVVIFFSLYNGGDKTVMIILALECERRRIFSLPGGVREEYTLYLRRQRDEVFQSRSRILYNNLMLLLYTLVYNSGARLLSRIIQTFLMHQSFFFFFFLIPLVGKILVTPGYPPKWWIEQVGVYRKWINNNKNNNLITIII